MTGIVDNTGEADYRGKLAAVAARLKEWDGPIVILGHVDPDGDALGSTLALKRALERLGKDVTLPFQPPGYLAFIAEEGELSPDIESLPERCLLAVLDTNLARSTGAPVEGAAFTVNIDHHGTNPREADLNLVEPGKAATAVIVKELIDVLGVEWDSNLATPCLTGILTDTGNFRFANTGPEVLRVAGELMDTGVDYPWLTDRLQWRPRDYYRVLGKVMSTIEFPLDGKLVLASMSNRMREELAGADEESDDFVGVIRYVEGSKVAVFLKEIDELTKVSVRTRDGVSAQAICVELGGGGHVAAAGAKLPQPLPRAREIVIEAVKRELERANFL